MRCGKSAFLSTSACKRRWRSRLSPSPTHFPYFWFWHINCSTGGALLGVSSLDTWAAGGGPPFLAVPISTLRCLSIKTAEVLKRRFEARVRVGWPGRVWRIEGCLGAGAPCGRQYDPRRRRTRGDSGARPLRRSGTMKYGIGYKSLKKTAKLKS